MQKYYERQSSRIDTGTEGLSRAGAAVRVEGEKYYNSATEKHHREIRVIYGAQAKEIFGPLVK